jgi:hypothetical protein
VWHASIAAHSSVVTSEVLRRTAYAELDGVGDPAAGEWEDPRDGVFHLRRRLTVDEQATVGPAVDIRGTWEATKRHRRVARWLPAGFPQETPA